MAGAMMVVVMMMPAVAVVPICLGRRGPEPEDQSEGQCPANYELFHVVTFLWELRSDPATAGNRDA
jgi:hypothetical protein